jgi:glucose-1-phosphate cytidylyltransferase
MKTIILCGGLGTRISEETQLKPKPMVEIGGKPILSHVMKIYEKFNHKDFILALGYKGEVIKDYFLNYHSRMSDFSVNLADGKINFINPTSEDWNVTLVDTGSSSMTGGRLLRLKQYIKNETFMLTYGDGVSDINIDNLIKFHKSHGKIATVTSVRPPARFGGMKIINNKVEEFKEKPQSGEGWINGGFFIFEPEIFNYLQSDETILEQQPLENLSKDGQLMAYEHDGYWQCMDTVRDRDSLQELWSSGKAPWRK